MIRFDNFSFSYPDEEKLYHQVQMDIPTDKLTILSGANGSGKTTICRILSGLQKKYQGSVKIDDTEINLLSVAKLAEKLVYLKQEPLANVVATTPKEDLNIWLNHFSKSSQNEDIITAALDNFSLEDLHEQPTWELSSGQIKRIGLAAVSLFPNKYWILDEPTAGLDHGLISSFIQLLKEREKQGLGTMIVTHRIELFKNMNPNLINIEKRNIIQL